MAAGNIPHVNVEDKVEQTIAKPDYFQNRLHSSD